MKTFKLYRLRKILIDPYEYGSTWKKCKIFMFPIILDVATTIHQIQGITLSLDKYKNCFIDMQGMDRKALYVAMSRFENEDQIKGIINTDDD